MIRRRQGHVGRPAARWWRVGRLAVVVTAMAAVVPVLVIGVSAWARGATFHAVRSASMEPQVPEGSMVVVLPAEPAEIEEGAIVLFDDPSDPGRLVVHRVRRSIDGPAGGQFETQGDANPGADPALVPSRMVRGEVRWHITGAGTVVETLGRRDVGVALASVPLGALAVSEIVGVRRRRRHRSDGSRAASERAEVMRPEPAAASTAPTTVPTAPMVASVTGRRIVLRANTAGGGAVKLRLRSSDPNTQPKATTLERTTPHE